MFLRVGEEHLTSLSTATALTVPTGATAALVTAESQAVRYRADIDPTATVGTPLAVDTSRWIFDKLSSFKFIEQTASAKIHVEYYRMA